MDKSLLLDAVRQLSALRLSITVHAPANAVLQFNALLEHAKRLYPSRPDILSLRPFPEPRYVGGDEFSDSTQRLFQALDLRRPGTVTELAGSIELPPDAPPEMQSDLSELQAAVALGLRKTALLLSGSIAEAVLLVRHPDTSERGPGLSKLLELAKDQRLFGRDTLRQLETLNDYRDLIHTRAGPRNRIVLNDARVEHAVMALKLLCAELKDIKIRYSV